MTSSAPWLASKDWPTRLRRPSTSGTLAPTCRPLGPCSLTHVPLRFDILGHRADDLVVPDPGLKRRLGVFGRTRGLPPGASPYEGSVLQRTPRQRLILLKLILQRWP